MIYWILTKYISVSYQIEFNMIVLTTFIQIERKWKYIFVSVQGGCTMYYTPKKGRRQKPQATKTQGFYTLILGKNKFKQRN